MAMTGADSLVDTLIAWGVDTVFGIPGDGINAIMEALRQRQDRIQFIQVRHEETAALAACGYAKYTGRLGVCLGTSGPGGIHLLNGLYDAKLDQQPVLAITGSHYHDLTDTFGQQDVALDRVFQDVAVYNTRIMGPAHVEPVVNLACRAALTHRGVSHITFPVDLQSESVKRRSMRNVPEHTTVELPLRAQLPDEGQLRQAAEILNRGRKVAILAGRGALGAGSILEAVAERLDAPIVKALLGKAVVPDDSPYTTGGIGLLGTRPSQDAMESCDTLLIAGSSFPYIEFYPKPRQARGIQIDIEPARIGLRYPVEVGLLGDVDKTLNALLPLLSQKPRGLLSDVRDSIAAWSDLLAEHASRGDVPLKPAVLAYELGRQLPDDAIVSADSGTVTSWWARYIPARAGQMHSVSGLLATMGCALPYAIAAQLAYPDRTCIAFVGDGGFSMLMADLVTFIKYSLPVKVFIIKNGTLGQIRWEQMVFEGNPEYGCELQPIDFAAFARACGATGIHVEDPADCADVVARALETPGPVVVEAVVDPFEPAMPPRVTAEQVTNMVTALARGEPYSKEMVATIAASRVREMI
jgi:pyruvate dehydrogenase (quinone)